MEGLLADSRTLKKEAAMSSEGSQEEEGMLGLHSSNALMLDRHNNHETFQLSFDRVS